MFDQQADRREALTALIAERPFSDRAAQFLLLAVDAAHAHAANGVRCIWRNGKLWMQCEQARLGELLSCTDRTVRTMVANELEPLGFVKRVKAVPVQDGPPREVTIYVIDRERLEAVPVLDPTDPIDAAILSTSGDPWSAESEAMHAAHNVDETPISGGSSGGSSGHISGGVSGGSSGLSKNPVLSCPVKNINNSSPPVPVQDRSAGQEGESFIFNFDFQEGPRRPFNDIPPDHVRAIAGYSPGGRRFSDLARQSAFVEYFRDAVAAGFAEPGDACLMLAIFKTAGDRMGPDTPGNLKLRDPQSWIRSVWNARHTKPPGDNAAIRKALIYARNLLAYSHEGTADADENRGHPDRVSTALGTRERALAFAPAIGGGVAAEALS